MSRRAREIAGKIESFKNEVVSFVQACSSEDWKKNCRWEEWPVGVTACHIGGGHFTMDNMIGMIVNGEEFPQLTMDQINEMSKKRAQKLSGCTREEALELLEKNGTQLAAFVKALSDDDLDRKAHMAAFGGEVSTEAFIE
jgi:hypothetical protein